MTGTAELTARLALSREGFGLDVDLALPGSGVTAVFGASGAGKTTLLRALAGLERAAGAVTVHGEPWQDDARGHFLPPHRRALGFVFQEGALFEHLDVRGNLRFALRRVPADRRRLSEEEVVAWFGLEPLLARRPARLSGGERQRVALARAVLASPRLLLLDEPLAALDEPARRGLLAALAELPGRLDAPVLFVSHTTADVARLAARVLWLEDGRVRAEGATGDVLTRLDFAAARGDEACAVLEARAVERDETYALTGLACPFGRLWVPSPTTGEEPGPETRLRVRVLARDVSLARDPEAKSSILNTLPARVVEVADPAGGQVLVRLASEGPDEAYLLARITQKSRVELGVEPGERLLARVKSVGLA